MRCWRRPKLNPPFTGKGRKAEGGGGEYNIAPVVGAGKAAALCLNHQHALRGGCGLQDRADGAVTYAGCAFLICICGQVSAKGGYVRAMRLFGLRLWRGSAPFPVTGEHLSLPNVTPKV